MNANNLYGWTTSKNLSYAILLFSSETEVKAVDIFSIDSVGRYGNSLEIDLDHPSGIHDKNLCLPFCADNKIPSTEKYKKRVADLPHK